MGSGFVFCICGGGWVWVYNFVEVRFFRKFVRELVVRFFLFRICIRILFSI